MLKRLLGAFGVDQPLPAEPPTVESLEREVAHLDGKLKWRSSMGLIAILFALVAGAVGQHELNQGVHDNTCAIKGLVFRATPTVPRPLGKHGPILHYTPAQVTRTLLFRRLLLAGLPEATCSLSPPGDS